MASEETSALSPSEGEGIPALTSASASSTFPFTNLTAANQAFRELMEKNQRQIDILSHRLDSLSTMMNTLVLSQSSCYPVLNATGGPPTSGLITPHGQSGSSYVHSTHTSLPVLHPSLVQPATQYSVGLPACSLAAVPQHALTSSLVFPEGTLTPARSAVTLSNGGEQPNIEHQSSSYQPHRSGSPPRGHNGDIVGEVDNHNLGSVRRGPRHGCGHGSRNPPLGWNSRHAAVEDDDYALNREYPETQCKSLPIEQFDPADKDQDFTIWMSQFEDAVNQGHNPHSKSKHYNHCLSWLPNYLHPDAYIVMKRHKHCVGWEELKKKLLSEFEDPTIRMEWRSNLDAYMWDEHKESLTSYCSRVKKFVDTFDADIASIPQARSNRYYIRFLSGLPDDYQRQVKLKTSSKKLNVDRALDVCLRYQSVKKEGLG